MSETRGFRCQVYEGTYRGEMVVWVDADAIEQFGNEEIERAAKRQWRKDFGPAVGMAATGVKILEEVEPN